MASCVTWSCRLIGATSALAYCTSRHQLDIGLQHIWDVLRYSKLVRHDSFEPLLVVVSFALWHLGFYLLDTLCPAGLKPWRIQSSQDQSHWRRDGYGRTFEALCYGAPIFMFDALYPRRTLSATCPTVLQLLGEILAALVLYDAFFTSVHLALHKVPGLYRIHAKHHTKPVQRASEALRLSAAEVEFLDTGCSIAALNLLGCHPLSRLCYNVVLTYLITELHCGLDFPWMLQRVVPWGIWAGSLRHDHHHKVGRGCYQKIFTYLDDLLGFAPLA